jgi:outer membrane protein assembly factor BamD (BamD/ComL family)
MKTIPAAKLYKEALAHIEAGKNYEAMQALQKIASMEDAGHYAKLAREKLEEMKKNWRKRVK